MLDPPRILAYQRAPAVLRAWDPVAPAAAGRLIAAITAVAPDLMVDHIGSSAVAGCAGKGVIDLLVRHPASAGGLQRATAAVDGLGFQRQSSRDPFPAERPMRVGALWHAGTSFRVHVHIMAATAGEAADLLAFRDALRSDHALCAAYVGVKQDILARGVSDSTAYSVSKGGFIQRWLAARRPPSP